MFVCCLKPGSDFFVVHVTSHLGWRGLEGGGMPVDYRDSVACEYDCL